MSDSAFQPNPSLLVLVLLLTGVSTPSPSQADSPFLRATADANAAGGTDGAIQPVLGLGPLTITIAPGSNAVLELAIDHLNRIVTPFARPALRTVSSVTTEIDAKVLYIATASEEPATLYITDADDARTTVGLTIAPRRVPPREIRLRVPGLAKQSAQDTKSIDAGSTAPSALQPTVAATWRQPQPYIDELTTVFRALALDEMPEGLRARRAVSGESLTCSPPGLSVKRGQVFEGDQLLFVTATLRSTAKTALAIDAGTCRLRSGRAVAAVASWPRTELPPGAETDLYVAVRRDGSDDSAGARPGRRP